MPNLSRIQNTTDRICQHASSDSYIRRAHLKVGEFVTDTNEGHSWEMGKMRQGPRQTLLPPQVAVVLVLALIEAAVHDPVP